MSVNTIMFGIIDVDDCAFRICDIPVGLFVADVFGTKVYAVKTEYHNDNGECLCILLASGEYARFVNGDNTLVRRLYLSYGINRLLR